MLRDYVSITELEILMFLYTGKKRLTQISNLLSISRKATPVYLTRLRKRGIIKGERTVDSIYWLTDKGMKIIDEVKSRLV